MFLNTCCDKVRPTRVTSRLYRGTAQNLPPWYRDHSQNDFSKYEAQPRRYRHPTRIATAMLPRPQLQKHFTHIKAHGLLMFDLMLAPAWLHHDKESHVGMHSRHGCCLRCLSCRCSFLFPRSLHHRSGQLPFLVCLMRLHNMVKLVLLRNLAIPRVQ